MPRKSKLVDLHHDTKHGPRYKNYNIMLGSDLIADFDILLQNNETVHQFKNLLRHFNYYCTNFKPTRLVQDNLP